MILDLNKIKELIPHRHHFYLLILKIVEKGLRGISKRKFLPSEYFLKVIFHLILLSQV